eukprot:scaffold22851_cov68-Phaeocystis_antarctica.AAC.1
MAVEEPASGVSDKAGAAARLHEEPKDTRPTRRVSRRRDGRCRRTEKKHHARHTALADVHVADVPR